jgi:colicin import membrane protein
VVAEQAASQAEAQRVADARAATETATRKVASLEAALAEAESRKTAAEQAAANAETQRAESETQRLTAEKSAAAASASAKAQKAEAEAQRVNAETQAAKAEKQRRDDAEQHRVASETATQNAKDAVRREDTELASSARRYKADFAAAKEIIAQREKQLLDMDAVREERDVLAQMVRALRNQEASKKLTPLKVPKWLGGLGGGKG